MSHAAAAGRFPGAWPVAVQRRAKTPALQQQITGSLHAWKVPVQALHQLKPGQPLQHPLPLRGDLRETLFAASANRSWKSGPGDPLILAQA